MKTIGALQAWNNFSEYYAGQVGNAVKERYDLIVTYEQDPSKLIQFDIVWSFFPQFPKGDHGLTEKLVKTFWEPHEIGWDKGKVNVACSLSAFQQLTRANANALYAPLGVNTDHFSPKPFPEGKLKVGWCGEAANDRKQFAELEQAMGELKEYIEFVPNITKNRGGYVVGNYKTIPDMKEYYAGIHVYVCASAGEGFGLPLLEASACGRPVITFDVGIARQLKQDGAGVMIVNGFKELKEAVKELATANGKSGVVEYLGENSVRAVRENWQWHNVTEQWLKVFDSI